MVPGVGLLASFYLSQLLRLLWCYLHFEAKGTGLQTGTSWEDRPEIEEPGHYKEEKKHKSGTTRPQLMVFTLVSKV